MIERSELKCPLDRQQIESRDRTFFRRSRPPMTCSIFFLRQSLFYFFFYHLKTESSFFPQRAGVVATINLRRILRVNIYRDTVTWIKKGLKEKKIEAVKFCRGRIECCNLAALRSQSGTYLQVHFEAASYVCSAGLAENFARPSGTCWSDSRVANIFRSAVNASFVNCEKKLCSFVWR